MTQPLGHSQGSMPEAQKRVAEPAPHLAVKPPKGPLVSVLIVTYKNPALTRECLASLQPEVARHSAEVLLIDNDSQDGTLEMAAAEFPWIHIVPNVENLGFARGNNVLAEHARGRYLLLLNPDTVVHPGMLDALVALARDYPAAGLYCGRTLTPAGELDPTNVMGTMSLWSLFCFATGLSTVFKHHPMFNREGIGGWQRDDVRPVDVAAGCLLMIRRDIWDALGGFDISFWMYSEDVDLAIRAQHMGQTIMFTPAATITHVLGASSSPGAKIALVLGGRVQIMRKHWTAGRAWVGTRLLLLGCAVRAAGKRSDTSWRDTWRRRAEWTQVL